MSGGPSILKTKGHSTNHLGAGELIAVKTEDSFFDFSGALSLGSIENDDSVPPVKRRKQDAKTGKGLRHFSMKVTYTSDFFSAIINTHKFIYSNESHLLTDRHTYNNRNWKKETYHVLSLLFFSL